MTDFIMAFIEIIKNIVKAMQDMIAQIRAEND